jgi:uncharacterized membrane protein
MPRFCSACGAQMADGTTVCPACGQGAGQPVAATATQASTGGLTDNMAGLLCYLFIPAIIFLVMEPYNKNKFIRFHSFQSVFYCVALIIIGFGMGILGAIPIFNLLVIPIGFLVWIGSFILWIVLMLKAYQGQKFKLPIIGDMAEKQANA